ncbi:MAG: methyltransferase domain-containing protein [Johnsonella sp.]|nr:methyltransferase domain-containing protein [Johnsonella sp.]
MGEEKTMFHWNEDKIYWNIVCNESNQISEKIVEKIKPYIEGKKVAELGCGTGYFSLAMSKYADSVIAADIQSKVLDVLAANIKKRKIKNIIPIRTDIYESCFYDRDYMVAKFFLRPTRDLKKILSMAKEGVILIVNTTEYSGMNTDDDVRRGKENADTICPYLDSENLEYEKIELQCENGQYLRDEEDARNFLHSYTQNTESEIQEIIEESRLKEEYRILNEGFRFFISVDKRISILIIRKAAKEKERS